MVGQFASENLGWPVEGSGVGIWVELLSPINSEWKVTLGRYPPGVHLMGRLVCRGGVPWGVPEAVGRSVCVSAPDGGYRSLRNFELYKIY